MKPFSFSFGVLVAIGGLLFLGSCSENDDSTPPAEVNFSAENTARAAQTDNIIESTFDIMENGYVENSGSRAPGQASLFPECTLITVQPNGDGGTITLDFGDSCELRNGAVVSGKVLLEYGPIENATRTIEYVYQDFTYNSHGVTGGGTILRELSNKNGNPQSTVSGSIVVAFANSTVTATRTGVRVAEWTVGVDTGTWADNVYEITGNWNTQLSNGFERSGEVTEALIRKLSCPWLVSGALQVEQENLTAVIDFGEGECDAQATITINGQPYPIIL
jgi:hypothetical protein